MKHLQSRIEIIDEVTICPYCGDTPKGFSCCGESSAHFETGFVVEVDGKELEYYLTGDELGKLYQNEKGESK